MEGIGVFHHKFTTAHHAKTRTDFIAEFGLNLEEIHRQLLVRAQIAPHQIGNHFLMRRPQAIIALMAILDTQQLRPVILPASRFLPQFCRQYPGHHQFQGTGALHFLTHHLLHLLEHTKPQGRPAINAGSGLPDHTGAQHQLMTNHFGFRRSFLLSGQPKSGETHILP